jgi:hypothetical protein
MSGLTVQLPWAVGPALFPPGSVAIERHPKPRELFLMPSDSVDDVASQNFLQSQNRVEDAQPLVESAA